jgi:hypothetical protein
MANSFFLKRCSHTNGMKWLTRQTRPILCKDGVYIFCLLDSPAASDGIKQRKPCKSIQKSHIATFGSTWLALRRWMRQYFVASCHTVRSLMASSGQIFGFDLLTRQRPHMTAWPSTPTLSPQRHNQREDQPLVRPAAGGITIATNKYAGATRHDSPFSVQPCLVFALPEYPSSPSLKLLVYQSPQEASSASNDLRLRELASSHVASLNRQRTSRGRSLSRTHSPTFPYKAYVPLPDSPPTYSGIKFEDREKEVYALPASQRLLLPDSPTRCGRCLKPLRWGNALPNRCQDRQCQALNIGGEWAANERVRQAAMQRRGQYQWRRNTYGPERNYLGDFIGHDKLFRFYESDSEQGRDPVDWDSFLRSEILYLNDDGNFDGEDCLPT